MWVQVLATSQVKNPGKAQTTRTQGATCLPGQAAWLVGSTQHICSTSLWHCANSCCGRTSTAGILSLGKCAPGARGNRCPLGTTDGLCAFVHTVSYGRLRTLRAYRSQLIQRQWSCDGGTGGRLPSPGTKKHTERACRGRASPKKEAMARTPTHGGGRPIELPRESISSGDATRSR